MPLPSLEHPSLQGAAFCHGLPLSLSCPPGPGFCSVLMLSVYCLPETYKLPEGRCWIWVHSEPSPGTSPVEGLAPAEVGERSLESWGGHVVGGDLRLTPQRVSQSCKCREVLSRFPANPLIWRHQVLPVVEPPKLKDNTNQEVVPGRCPSPLVGRAEQGRLGLPTGRV